MTSNRLQTGGRSNQQPLQAVESVVVGQLSSAAGASGCHPKRRRGQTWPLGIPTVVGIVSPRRLSGRWFRAISGTLLPPGFLWIPARQIGARCGRRGAAAMLALCVGAGFGYPELLRSHRFRAADASGPQAYGLPVGASLHRTMAESRPADDGWKSIARKEACRRAGSLARLCRILSGTTRSRAMDMARNHSNIPFERYADDAICHCRSEEEAKTLRASLEERFAQCALTLHPDKTKVVYCKDDDRRGDYPDHRFDFLGYTFRPRLSRRWKGFGVSFSPAASGKALKSIRQTVRHWALHQRSDKTLDDLARMFNSHIRGWINYYGRYYKSALYPTLRHIDQILARWAHRKFKSLRRHKRRTHHWLANVIQRQPDLFVHWRLLYGRGRTMGAG